MLKRHKGALVHLESEIAKRKLIGLGIGYKLVSGRSTGELCLRCYVERKLPKSQLPKGLLVPKSYSVKDQTLITDVIAVGRIKALSYRDRMRPAPPGVSIAHKDVTAGTFGALVRDSKTGEALILSNNHVLANENKAKIGDAILQPGPYDGGKIKRDTIATLQRWIDIDFKKPNLIDAALAWPKDESFVTSEILDIGQVKGIAQARIGHMVQKTGRTTGHTLGEIQDISVTLKVEYDKGMALFRNQILTTAMSQGGDSGSLLLTKNNKACGLLFAGSDLATIFNPIRTVLELLGVRF